MPIILLYFNLYLLAQRGGTGNNSTIQIYFFFLYLLVFYIESAIYFYKMKFFSRSVHIVLSLIFTDRSFSSGNTPLKPRYDKNF
jgi:hypothetical protein